jgi:hypothetical protein
MKRLSVLFLVAACGSSAPKTATPPPPAGDQPPPAHGEMKDDNSPVVGPPQVEWKTMTHEQKGRFMDKVVMPKFKPMFQQFDGKVFAEFTCKTCHGDGAKDHTFKMPNPGIWVLPEAKEDFGKLAQEKPEWFKFMPEVEHEMATTLGMPPYDPAAPAPTQFGCFGCHTHKAGGQKD